MLVSVRRRRGLSDEKDTDDFYGNCRYADIGELRQQDGSGNRFAGGQPGDISGNRPTGATPGYKRGSEPGEQFGAGGWQHRKHGFVQRRCRSAACRNVGGSNGIEG